MIYCCWHIIFLAVFRDVVGDAVLGEGEGGMLCVDEIMYSLEQANWISFASEYVVCYCMCVKCTINFRGWKYCTVFGPSVKVFPTNFSWGGGIGHVRRGILRGKNSQKVSPLKVFYYTVSACFVTVVHFSCEYMYVLKCVWTCHFTPHCSPAALCTPRGSESIQHTTPQSMWDQPPFCEQIHRFVSTPQSYHSRYSAPPSWCIAPPIMSFHSCAAHTFCGHHHYVSALIWNVRIVILSTCLVPTTLTLLW